MPTSTTLSYAARRSRSSVVVQTLVVVADPADPGRPVPDWAASWSRRAQWELRTHPGSGPGAAAAAARPDVRVLMLRPEPTTSVPSRVVAAVRHLPDDRRVVADAAACAKLLRARLVIVHAVPRSFAERSVGLDGAVADGRNLLEAAADEAILAVRGCVVDGELLRAHPHEVVGETLRADLLVVGGPRTDHPGAPAGAGLGLVAQSALHHAACPVLITPR